MPFLTAPPVARRACAAVVLVAMTLTACTRSGADQRDTAAVVTDTAAAGTSKTVAVMPMDLDSLKPHPGVTIRALVVRRDTTTYGTGPAVATLSSGDTLVVADSAIRAWVLDGGRLVAVSQPDGAGGYENEGQALVVIEPATGRRRRVVADYFTIDRVVLASAGGRDALVVHMRDGGLGSVHVTIADPRRGQVFRVRNALARTAGDRIIVSSYGDGDAAVDYGETRPPIRVDTIPVTSVDSMALIVVPRSTKR